jgi:tRNA (guanine37-N1)-methyltransferase
MWRRCRLGLARRRVGGFLVDRANLPANKARFVQLGEDSPFAYACRSNAGLNYSPSVQIDILSLFPAIASAALGESMMRRAQAKGIVQFRSLDLRDWTHDRHRTYGGGQGMVMKCGPIFEAIEATRTPGARVVYMSPCGRRFNQKIAREYADRGGHVIFLSGHYEGVDQRVLDHLVDDELSIGDYVLTNGVIAAVVVVDAIVRLLPGVLGDENSAPDDSFESGLLEYPHYTRPEDFRGWKVPDILLSGNHGEIAKWRRRQAIERTRERRPDLLPPDAK